MKILITGTAGMLDAKLVRRIAAETSFDEIIRVYLEDGAELAG